MKSKDSIKYNNDTDGNMVIYLSKTKGPEHLKH